MIPSTTERVPTHTAEHVNERIRQRTLQNVERFRDADSVAIERRLQELDQEWDIERTLEANAASLVVVGSALGASVDKRFFILPAIVGTFLLQHAVQGWCPPLPVLRRLGFRTQSEIDEEKMALKAIRGDFRRAVTPSGNRAEKALEAARM